MTVPLRKWCLVPTKRPISYAVTLASTIAPVLKMSAEANKDFGITHDRRRTNDHAAKTLRPADGSANDDARWK